MDDSVKIRVKNRSHSPVYYHVADMNNLQRVYNGLEEKIVTFEELRKLSGTYGGFVILKDYLVVKNRQAAEELGLTIEPEYFYEKDDVIRILKEGSMDEFLDCLDFAPQGVIDMIKEYAVKLPLNDVAKRDVLRERYDYDVSKIIEVRDASFEDVPKEEPRTSQRRAAVPSQEEKDQSKPSNTGRRVIITTKEQ